GVLVEPAGAGRGAVIGALLVLEHPAEAGGLLVVVVVLEPVGQEVAQLPGFGHSGRVIRLLLGHGSAQIVEQLVANGHGSASSRKARARWRHYPRRRRPTQGAPRHSGSRKTSIVLPCMFPSPSNAGVQTKLKRISYAPTFPTCTSSCFL